ncbi:MAG: PASTA domain-containing protein [Candidatus Cloacimonetes bacterium]|nr:PASTA domain-containing protein [Candidatus Cloacimonadota bacterium]
MINKKVERFLEHTNMNYMFCLLSNLEVSRLNNLPSYVRQKFTDKITELAMEHVAQNEVPDYIMDIEEAKAEMERLGLTPEEYESGRREAYEDEEDFEQEMIAEDFQGEYKPIDSDDEFNDDFDDDGTDSDDD